MAEDVLTIDEVYTRPIRQEEAGHVFKFLEAEGWDIPLVKFIKLVEQFPKHVYVIAKKDTNEAVGTLSIIPTHKGQCVFGGFVVKSGYRGRGLGTALLKYGLELNKDSIITLTAVPGSTSFYTNNGFKDIGPSHFVTYLKVDRVKLQAALDDKDLDDIEIATYKPEMFMALNEYDMVGRGYDCGKYLEVVIAGSDCMLVAFSKTTQTIIGYASGVDVSSSFFLLDGMYADNDVTALLLFRKLLETFPKEVIKIQVIKPKDLLMGYGTILGESHTLTRMAKGGNPVPVSYSKVYSVACCNYADG